VKSSCAILLKVNSSKWSRKERECAWERKIHEGEGRDHVPRVVQDSNTDRHFNCPLQCDLYAQRKLDAKQKSYTTQMQLPETLRTAGSATYQSACAKAQAKSLR
jgi:hypothetical protein